MTREDIHGYEKILEVVTIVMTYAVTSNLCFSIGSYKCNHLIVIGCRATILSYLIGLTEVKITNKKLSSGC